MERIDAAIDNIDITERVGLAVVLQGNCHS